MSRTKAITQSKIAILTAVVAAILLLFAVPRLLVSIVTAPSAVVLRELQNQEPVTFEELETIVRAQRRGLFFVNDGRLYTDLGLAELLMAERLSADHADVNQHLENAVRALKEGLAVAPGNPYAWARLAYAEARLRGWTPVALSSLRLALLTAAFEPRLLWSRLRLGFLAWSHMTVEDQEIMFQQIRTAWEENPTELARLARDLGRVDVVRTALLRFPHADDELQELLKSLPS
ncbi:MAG: hypothetical protein H6905_07065 [Hyphomicrobiales bacterium]|nr:hypothetical protein [Hyphomicrobiales bacterium]